LNISLTLHIMMNTVQKMLALLSGAALVATSTLTADSVSTTPVGYSTWMINAGTGTARTFTTLALPLYSPTSSIDGVTTGVITSVATDTLSVDSAGWTVGELSDAEAPFCLRITSGLATGRNLLVSSSVDNTSDTLTVDLSQSGVSDLTALGIVAATDTFEIIECDTLSSLFDVPSDGGIIGGDSLDSADNIWLFVNGAWSKYYYDTSLERWTQFSRGNPDASNQVILPDSGLLFSRIADETSALIITGTVPSTSRKLTVNQSGVTVVGSSWPVDMTLSEANFNQIAEWQSSTDASDADQVFVLSEGVWQRYYHDGTDWLKNSRGNAVSNDVVIGSGSAVLLLKASPSSSTSTLSQALPYSL
jgi:hypothetical protein